MSDHHLLLGRFAAFYAEVARVKQLAAGGTLADDLARDQGSTPATPQALARATCARLAQCLDAQQQELARHGTEAQLRLHASARYVMGALADDLLIFELDWPARDAWLDALLEHRLFGTRLAGQLFFEKADEVLAAPVRDPLHRDLAGCFLLALQLGFQGMHRGPAGAAALADLRRRLWQYVHGDAPEPDTPVLFPQAAAHTVRTARDPRIAPLGPWLRAARWWLLGFLAASSLVWLVLVQPLLRLGD